MPRIPRPPSSKRFAVSDAEITTSLASFSNGRAAGGDEIVFEMVNHFGDTARRWLFGIVRRSISTGSIPQEWRHSVVVPLPKPGKDSSSQ